MAGVTFTKNAAERTKKAVITVEREYSSTAGEQRRGKGAPYLGFYAKITAGSPPDKKYSWEKIEYKADGTWASKSEWGTGDRTKDTGYAVESMYQSGYVPVGSIVWMYPAPGQDYFLFEFEGRPRLARVGPNDIPAKSGSTLGKGIGFFEKQVVDNVELDDKSPASMQFYNPSAEPVKASSSSESVTRIIVQMICGRWLIIWEDCN